MHADNSDTRSLVQRTVQRTEPQTVQLTEQRTPGHGANDFAAASGRAVPTWDAWLRLLGRTGGIEREVRGVL